MDKDYSVLMSVYEKEKPEYLRQSIESILSQTVKAKEFVIVCDGPLTEELEQVIRTYADRYPQLFKIVRLEHNQGLGIALNAGLDRCTSELVARMDSDDISLPDRMEKQLQIMDKENVDIVSGTVIEFTDNVNNELARRVLPEKQEEIRRFLRRRNPFNHPAVMYKKESVMAAGGYKDFRLFEDYYLWIRMLAMGCEGYNIREPLVYMRSGDGMYERRGGIKYAGQIVKFRWYMLQHGYAGLLDFVVAAGGHALVALIPNSMRKKFYERVLRK
ncbi:MAG: glycosyltransferase [Alistipes sp.]|nr:glycosyltransferase [Alistipes sp.]